MRASNRQHMHRLPTASTSASIIPHLHPLFTFKNPSLGFIRAGLMVILVCIIPGPFSVQYFSPLFILLHLIIKPTLSKNLFNVIHFPSKLCTTCKSLLPEPNNTCFIYFPVMKML